jgi:hypothetical protein
VIDHGAIRRQRCPVSGPWAGPAEPLAMFLHSKYCSNKFPRRQTDLLVYG